MGKKNKVPAIGVHPSADKRPAYAVSPSNVKQPAIGAMPRPTRVPAVAPRDAEHSQHTVVWKLAILDLHGKFGWSSLNAGDVPSLLDKVRSIETRRWAEIDASSKHDHYITWTSLSSEAQRRMTELQLEDGADLLFSFRLDGTTRIYGLRKNNVFCVIWWDPAHAVCPSYKKNT